jgi:hypothetical protein
VPWGPPGHPERKFWTAEEDALLGTATDKAVGARIGRTWRAVSQRPAELGIASFRYSKGTA